MNEKMEIEKKFLVKMPEFEALNIKNQFEILQTYLKNGENNSQRRVRRIAENGRVSYIYTEKNFLFSGYKEGNGIFNKSRTICGIS